MIEEKVIKKVTSFCIDNLELESEEFGNEYNYSCMPLCVVDSVFSIGVRYEGVINTVERLCTYYDIPQAAEEKMKIPPIDQQLSTTEFLKLFGDKTPAELANEVYKNRQRTSSNNGILKAEAVIRFLKVLKDFNAEYFQDIPRLIDNSSFEFCIKNIPGQKSGISLKYFFMLAGTDDFIKPDRMIIRFLQDATGQKLNLEQCQTTLFAVTGELNKQGYTLTPKQLDNLIWNYQRML